MSELKDFIAYFIKHYPYPWELSKSKLTKMVYLADWKSAIEYQKQLTNIKWVYNHYGPYVYDVAKTASEDPFFVEETENFFDAIKEIIRLKDENYIPNITEEEQKVLDHIIKTTEKRNWYAFIKLVYSTYPIVKSQRYDALDLVSLAREYKNGGDNLPPSLITLQNGLLLRLSRKAFSLFRRK